MKTIKELKKEIMKTDYRKDALTEYDLIKAQLTQTNEIIKLLESQKYSREELIKKLKGEK